MEELKVNKNDMLAAYRAGNADQKAVLEKLYGKEVFAKDWHEITSYKKACEVLGISPTVIFRAGGRSQYAEIAIAVYKMLVICEAINGKGKLYDEDGFCHYPLFAIYPNEEMQEIGESECQSIGIHKILAAKVANFAGATGVRLAGSAKRILNTDANYGYPVCLNSEEKADFVGKQFFELCCQCYGINPKMD